MADGSTLIALSYVPGKRFAVLQSVTRQCAPNREFGNDGAARITIPPRLKPAHTAAGGAPASGLWVNVVAARKGGGAIVAGTYEGVWVVGEVTPRGQFDPRFGNGGWTLLPFGGEVSAILQEPSGRIVIGGDNDGGGCCNRNWAAALSGHGQLERGFGSHGRTELPTGEDSGVEGLALEPNGDILAEVGYGNMGCWGEALAMLTPSGRPLPGFEKRFGRFWHRLGFGAFVGDVYVERDGFTLVGTGEKGCDKGAAGTSAPSAEGLIARFRTNGEPTSKTIRSRFRMYGEIQAFDDGPDALVVGSPYTDSTKLTLMALRPDGSFSQRFGSSGRVRVRTPWKGRNAAVETKVLIAEASPRVIVLIATAYGRNLQIIRLRF